MKSNRVRSRYRGLEAETQPLGRMIVAADIEPGTKHDKVIFAAIKGDCLEVGQFIAPLLASGDVPAIKQLMRDVAAFHAHKPSPDLFHQRLAECAAELGGFTNGIAHEPLTVPALITKLRAKGHRITAAAKRSVEARIRRDAWRFGIRLVPHTKGHKS